MLPSLQRLQLGILVVSLEDPSHVAALLGYGSSEDAPTALQDPSATLPRDLMRTLLANLRFHTVSPCCGGGGVSVRPPAVDRVMMALLTLSLHSL